MTFSFFISFATGIDRSSVMEKDSSATEVQFHEDVSSPPPAHPLEDERPWYKQPELRKLYLMMPLLFLGSTTLGYDGSLLNGLQTMPAWQVCTFSKYVHRQMSIMNSSNSFIFSLPPSHGFPIRSARRVPWLRRLRSVALHSVRSRLLRTKTWDRNRMPARRSRCPNPGFPQSK